MGTRSSRQPSRGGEKRMRRMTLLLVLVVAGLPAVALAAKPSHPSTPASSNAKHGGVMCVLNTQLNASNETTGSTSTATGHAQVKVWNDGTITFKTQDRKSTRLISSH